MLLETRQFGVVEVPDEEIIHFPKGLLGFETLERYIIIDNSECQPFRWLQSVDAPELAFVIVNPVVFFPDYKVVVHAKEVADIGVRDPRDVQIEVIVTIPSEFDQMSANLQGPLLINFQNRTAKQLVLTNSDFGVQHLIVEQLDRKSKGLTKHQVTAVEFSR